MLMGVTACHMSVRWVSSSITWLSHEYQKGEISVANTTAKLGYFWMDLCRDQKLGCSDFVLKYVISMGKS